MVRWIHIGIVGLLFSLCGSAEASGREMPPSHHPVGIHAPAKMSVDRRLPLGSDRKLECDTCHGVEGIEEMPLEEVDSTASDFLRGGPYDRFADFCFQCHGKEAYEPLNIHDMRTPDGTLITDNCKFCHEEQPDPEKEVDRDALRFRLPVAKLCIGCHLKAPHLNAARHGTAASEEMQEIIRESEREHGVILPLDEEGRVTCSTCHTPHGPGALDANSPAGRQVADTSLKEGIVHGESPWGDVFSADKKARLNELAREQGDVPSLAYRPVEKEILLRLLAKDGTLCQACHRFDD